MKQTWKKLSAWLLTAAMLLTMLPAMAITASAAGAKIKRTTQLNLSVKGQEASNSDEGWSWGKNDDGSWTLTLDNVDIEVSDNSAIYIDAAKWPLVDVNIVLIGENSVVSTKPYTASDTAASGLQVWENKGGTADITFSGTGSLTVKGEGYGLYVPTNVVFNGVTVEATGKNAGGIALEDDEATLNIKNNSNVTVYHGTGTAVDANSESVYAKNGITVENSTLNIFVNPNNNTIFMEADKAGAVISVSNSTLVLKGSSTDSWSWGLSAPSVNVTDSTVDIQNIYNLTSAVFGAASNHVATLKNVNGTLLNTASVAQSSATITDCNLFQKSKSGAINIYGDAVLPDIVSEISSTITFKDNGSLTIPAGKTLTISAAPNASSGTIINNGTLVITGMNIFSGSSCSLSGSGEFIVLSEATADTIVVPTDLRYTGEVLLTKEDTNKVYLAAPSNTVTILGKEFKQQIDGIDGWILSFDREVKEVGTYTATFTKDGKTISKTFFVAEPPAYTIETYIMGTDGEYGQPDIETKNSVVNSTVSVSPENKEGFTVDASSILSGTIPADGAPLALKVYYKRNQYTFKTIVDGAEKTEQYYYGATITKPADPTKTGYTFDGWDKEIPDTMPAENMTITAKWKINQYTITFANTGDSVIPDITQDYGSAVTATIADPTKAGHTFDGWDKDIPATMPAENVTITAKWKVNTYTIAFADTGDTTIPAIQQDYGTAVNVTLPVPTKTGYTFLGWDKELPETMPVKGMVITAQWKINQYTITFDANGGSAVGAITQDYGTAVTAPGTPTKADYTFAGWLPQVPATMPAENLTLIAQWTAIPENIITPAAGGSVVVDKPTPAEGDTVTITPVPESGMQVDTVTAADASGNPVAVVDNGDGSYSFVQPEGIVTISVTFEAIPRETASLWLPVLARLYMTSNPITAIAGEGGSISDEGSTQVKYGRNHSYVITPDEGYVIADVLVGGKSVGAVSEYTFKKVRRAQVIEVVFAPIADEEPDVIDSDIVDPMFAYLTGIE